VRSFPIRSSFAAALVLALALPALAEGQTPPAMGGLGVRAPAPKGAADAKAVAPKKAKAIRRLLVASNASETGDAIVAAIRQSLPLPGDDEFWNTWTKKFLTEFEDELVVIYDRHFGMEEIEALTKFYESAIGKRILSKQRAIAMDSAAAGQALGMRIVEAILQESQGKDAE